MLKFVKKALVMGGVGYAVLFSVFFFDLDGKLLYNVVEPFLVKHYDNMERKDTLTSPYDTDKYGKYEFETPVTGTELLGDFDYDSDDED